MYLQFLPSSRPTVYVLHLSDDPRVRQQIPAVIKPFSNPLRLFVVLFKLYRFAKMSSVLFYLIKLPQWIKTYDFHHGYRILCGSY